MLTALAPITLEIYLLHEKILLVAGLIVERIGGPVISNYIVFNLGGIFMTFLASYLVKKIADSCLIRLPRTRRCVV